MLFYFVLGVILNRTIHRNLNSIDILTPTLKLPQISTMHYFPWNANIYSSTQRCYENVLSGKSSPRISQIIINRSINSAVRTLDDCQQHFWGEDLWEVPLIGSYCNDYGGGDDDVARSICPNHGKIQWSNVGSRFFPFTFFLFLEGNKIIR